MITLRTHEMPSDKETQSFKLINRAYNTVFSPNKLSIGLVVPLENYSNGPRADDEPSC